MKYTTPEQPLIPGGLEDIQEFMDPSPQKLNTAVMVLDNGDAMTTVTVPRAGLVTVENVVETFDDFNEDSSTVIRTHERITHVVITIPVFQNPDGTYYSVRNMKNS